MTPATYDAIGNHFRSLWGQEAGWAHSVLFTADLRAFSERLSRKVEISTIKQEDVQENPSEVMLEKEVKTEIEEKGESEADEMKRSIVMESARDERAKRRRTS